MNFANMMTLTYVSFLAASAFAGPRVDQSEVLFSQDDSRLCTVTYTLTGEPAIVTVDFQTNSTPQAASPTWVSIGAQNFTSVFGDVNRIVDKVDQTCTIQWQPRVDIPPCRVSGQNIARAVVTAWATNTPPDYMVLDLTAPGTERYYVSTNALPYGGLSNQIYKTSLMVMRRIPAAGVTWRMGSPASEGDVYNDPARKSYETPHYVSFTEDFWMGVFKVTRKQYNLLVGTNPGSGADNVPANTFSYNTLRGSYSSDRVNWPDTLYSVGVNSALATARSTSGVDFDLATSAQWEYACRAGERAATYWGDDNGSARLGDYAWYSNNSAVDGTKQSHEVGLKHPNAWGLYDMYGNVSEFVLDFYKDAGSSASVTNPKGVTSAEVAARYRILRGTGRFDSGWKSFRSAAISYTGEGTGNQNFGVRFVCPIGLKYPAALKPAL